MDRAGPGVYVLASRDSISPCLHPFVSEGDDGAIWLQDLLEQVPMWPYQYSIPHSCVIQQALTDQL
jgi:hypothetical protein